MGFLAPMMMLGGLAVGVPIGLHFFYKARYRPLPWAAMRFLRQSVEQTSRRLKFQEWVLLALRCLILLLLALAIARPTLSTLSAGGRGESVDAILVFDTSYSMGAADGEGAKESRLDRAKTAALTVIDNLPPRSTVQIITCSDRATLIGPVSPGNLDQAKNLVQNLELSSLSGEILPGLTEAYAALDRGVGTNKEVYLFSDLQKTGWNRQEGAIRAKASEIKARATMIVVRCGNPDRKVRNLQIADITYPDGLPHTGTRLPVTVLLKNTGKEPVRNATVTLEVDGKLNEREARAVFQKDEGGRMSVPEVGPGQTVPVNLTVKLEDAGARLLTARLLSDAGEYGVDDVPGDNQLDRMIPVREKVRILIVDGAIDLRDQKQSASFFVRNALLPVSDAQAENYFVKVEVVSPEDAGPGLLAATDICVLTNVAAANGDRSGYTGLSRDFVERLTRFVRGGGGLLISAGDNVIPASYNSVFGNAGAKLLPFDLAPAVSTKPEQPFKAAPDSADTTSFLARFKEVPYSTVTADVDFMKVIPSREEARGGRVLLRLADGTPLISSRPVGEGEVIFVSSSLDMSWGNWPAKGGSFLSLIRTALAYLTGRATQGVNRTVGEPLVWHPTEASKAFDIVMPNRNRIKLGKAVGGAGERLTITAPDTPIAGIYQFAVEKEEPPSGPRFAVAPDLRETDNLESLTDPEMEQAVGFRPVLILAGVDSDSLADERNRRELTVWVLLLLFFAICGEAVWAWMCGKAW